MIPPNKREPSLRLRRPFGAEWPCAALHHRPPSLHTVRQACHVCCLKSVSTTKSVRCLFRALAVSKYANLSVFVCVTNDFRHLSTTQFWKQMKALHFVCVGSWAPFCVPCSPLSLTFRPSFHRIPPSLTYFSAKAVCGCTCSWLRNNYGLPITPAQLPPTVGAIKLDDPYRRPVFSPHPKFGHR